MKSFIESDSSKVIDDIRNIYEQTMEELEKENIDKKKVTKLMYEQMLKGLYLQQNPNMMK